MNGSMGVYPDKRSEIGNPVIVRILSPDKFVQAPAYTQSYNRYSYCFNNPLRFTDPSGWYVMLSNGHKVGNDFNDWEVSNSADLCMPGSSGHWSDGMRSQYGNSMLGDKSSFDKMYGPGAWNIAQNLASNPALRNQWRQGMISIEQVRRNGGNPYLGPTAGLAGDPGKSVVENQYGRWVYNMQGVWVQTANKGEVPSYVGGIVQNEKFNADEKTAIGIIAINGSVKVVTEIIDKLSGAVKNGDIVNFGKATGVKFGIVGVATTTYFAVSDGKLTTGDGARILISGLTFIPYIGWTYGLIDMGTLLVTGTSVTDRIGLYIDQK